TGMQLADARATTVSRNRIYNIPSTAGSTGTLIGINFAGASGTAANVTLVNNFVSIVPQFTNAQVVKGIQHNGLSGNTFTADFTSYAGSRVTAANFVDDGCGAAGTAVSFATWKNGPPARDANSIANTASTYTIGSFFADANNGDLHLRRVSPSTLNPAEDTGT